MYDDLVKRLREPCQYENCVLCQQAADAIEELVGFVQEAERDRDEYRERLDKANDAIEEQSLTAESYKRSMEAWADEAANAQHRWIPVTERLPEEPYGCLLIVWDSPYDGGDDFLNYLPYFAGWDGEQWNDDDGIQVPFEVAYWMPLPEPPQEVDT